MRFRRLQRFRSLSAQGKRILFEAATLPLAVSLSFRMMGVPKTQQWLRQWATASAAPRPGADVDLIHETVSLQKVVRRTWAIGGSCLVRSLTLWAILLRRGVETELRVGFRRSGDGLEGHAWIEHNGIPLNENAAVVETYETSGGAARFDRFK